MGTVRRERPGATAVALTDPVVLPKAVRDRYRLRAGSRLGVAEEDRLECLREQLAWADRNNLLHRIQMFFDAMPVSAWNRVEK